MSILSLCPMPIAQFFSNTGLPLSGGRLYTYEPGAPGSIKYTFTDSTGNSVNTAPVVLDSSGRASIWLDGYYYMELWTGIRNAPGSTLIWSQDNVSSEIAITDYLGNTTSVPWVDASAYTTLQDAIAVISSTPTMLLIKEILNVPTNTVVPSNVQLYFIKGGRLQISGGITVTINGDIVSGLNKIFNTSGSVIGLCVAYPEWWGAKGDGITDSTAAFKQALVALENGGKLILSVGSFKLVDELTLPSGIIVDGSGNVDRYYGLPTGNESPTFIYQATTGKSIFYIPGNRRDIQIKNLALSSTATPSYPSTPSADKYGIKMEGIYPNSTFRLSFEHLTFYNFARGISVNDPAQVGPGSPVDWQCDDVMVSQVAFYNNTIGIYFNSTNADYWKMSNLVILTPPNGDGIYIQRAGYLDINNSAGGGLAATGSSDFSHGDDFIHVSQYYDIIRISSTQTEAIANFLHVDSTNDYKNIYYPIIIDACAIESPSTIERQAHLISIGSRYTEQVIASGSGIVIDSYSDMYLNGSSIVLGENAFDMSGTGGTLNVYPNVIRSGVGSPLNILTPKRVGEEYWDISNLDLYVATAMGGSYWEKIGGSVRFGQPSGIHDSGKMNDTRQDGTYLYLCTATGTTGTLSAGTGSITIGTAVLANTSGTIPTGSYITINGVTGIKHVIASEPGYATIDTPSSATVSGATIAYAIAAWKRVLMSDWP